MGNKNRVGYLDYVCPSCFHTLIECECGFTPWKLVNIDRGIQEQIRVLNKKGYITTYCCESHCNTDSIYISFAMSCGIGESLSVPDGFVFKKSNNSIYYTYKRNIDRAEFFKQKERRLAILLEWCNKLPDRKVAK